jgi:hypothetical protein
MLYGAAIFPTAAAIQPDGWMPNGARVDELVRLMPTVTDENRAAGRDPDRFPITAYGAPPDGARLQSLREAGVARAVFMLPPEPAERIEPLLDQYAALIAVQERSAR